jgi:penicillin-binding protein 1A
MKRFLFRLITTIVILSLGLVAGGYFALMKGAPQVDEIRGYIPSNGAKVYADDDTFLGEFKIEKGEYVRLDRIPDHLLKAIVSVEDSNFWVHKGLDHLAIVRAILKDIIAGKIKEGASTITQQLAKVVFLSPEKTVIRKLKEMILAYRIEQKLTKEEILELYLNKVYFGNGAYGVEMASKAYFGKSVSDINLAEASLLCGLVKAPSRYSPYRNLDEAKQRQYIVLKRMNEEGYITKEQFDKAYNQPLYLSSLRYKEYTPNYFLEYIRKHLEDEYGVDMVYKGGIKVYTTLNRDMQDAAVAALKEGLRTLDKRQGFRGVLEHKEIDAEKEMEERGKSKNVIILPGDLMTATVLKVASSVATVKTRGIIGKLFISDADWARKVVDSRGKVTKRFETFRLTDILKAGDIINVRVKDVKGEEPLFSLEQEPLVQGALVSIEVSTGYIRAIVGGYDFNKSEFNRAVFAKRQAGSAFKPIVFAAAIDYGYTPASVVMDAPLSYANEGFGDWTPGNYDDKYHGPTRLREALAYSRNIATIKLLEDIGVQRVIRFARGVGINGPFPNDLTLALGSLSVSPLEITSAFTVFAREGVNITPVGVKYILDSGGNVIENNKSAGVRAIDPQTAFLTTSMLEDVVNQGTGGKAKALNRPVAGKTGTTNDYKDAWFIGYTNELAAGVWVGFDDMRTLGKNETGSSAAAPIWVSFMQKALSSSGEEIKPFHVPDGIVTAVIDPLTGLLATNDSEKMVEFFKEGSLPKERSTKSHRDMVRKQKEEMSNIQTH